MAAAPQTVSEVKKFQPRLGVIVVTNGSANKLDVTLQSCLYELDSGDHVALLVNGKANEAVVQNVVKAFDQRAEYKWTLTTHVQDTEDQDVSKLKNAFQNTIFDKTKITHVHHMVEGLAYLPGLLTQMKRLLSSVDSVLLFETVESTNHPSCIVYPTSIAAPDWPSMDSPVASTEQCAEASTFCKAIQSLVTRPGAIQVHSRIHIAVYSESHEDFSKNSLSSSLYYTKEVSDVLRRKWCKYDAAKRMHVIHFNNQTTGGLNVALEGDPAVNVPKRLAVIYYSAGILKRVEFGEDHVGDVHVELGPI
jgi:hypothetical protein